MIPVHRGGDQSSEQSHGPMAFAAKSWSQDLNSDLSRLESYKAEALYPQQAENSGGPTSLLPASFREGGKCVTGEADPPLWTWGKFERKPLLAGAREGLCGQSARG